MPKTPKPESAAAETPSPATTVIVTVTKFGEGRVSSGTHIAGIGDTMAAKGDLLEVDTATAAALEAKGFAEIAE